jgi:hypothetical protein
MVKEMKILVSFPLCFSNCQVLLKNFLVQLSPHRLHRGRKTSKNVYKHEAWSPILGEFFGQYWTIFLSKTSGNTGRVLKPRSNDKVEFFVGLFAILA